MHLRVLTLGNTNTLREYNRGCKIFWSGRDKTLLWPCCQMGTGYLFSFFCIIVVTDDKASNSRWRDIGDHNNPWAQNIWGRPHSALRNSMDINHYISSLHYCGHWWHYTEWWGDRFDECPEFYLKLYRITWNCLYGLPLKTGTVFGGTEQTTFWKSLSCLK